MKQTKRALIGGYLGFLILTVFLLFLEFCTNAEVAPPVSVCYVPYAILVQAIFQHCIKKEIRAHSHELFYRLFVKDYLMRGTKQMQFAFAQESDDPIIREAQRCMRWNLGFLPLFFVSAAASTVLFAIF